MPTHTVRSPAWLLSGFTGSVAGELMLKGERLVFDARDGRRLFDAALGEVSDVTFPWYYFGGGVKLRIGTDRYRVSFARPGNLPDVPIETVGDLPSARESGKMWKSVLADSITNR